MKNILKITADQSPTLYSEQFKADYHSLHGAWGETQHVFIQAGLAYIFNTNRSVKVLETGYGTGLNALASLLFSKQNQQFIHYTSYELFPISDEEHVSFISSIAHVLGAEKESLLNDLFHLSWDEEAPMEPYFTLHKRHQDVLTIDTSDVYDIIFHDAFAPDTQPELWTLDIFEKFYKSLVLGGIIVTYCAKGIVKRRLKEAGFTVETLDGPPGKREMVRAIKNE